MNNYKQTKWIALLFLIMAMAYSDILAQNGMVLKTHELPSHNSLIRAWNNNLSIGYADDMQQGCFFLEDIANKHLTVIRLFDQVLVSDFRVYGNRVFFCGSFEGIPKRGVVGWFDINAVFYGTGSVYYGVFPPLSSSSYGMRRFTRMDVFEHAGNVHMALIGKLEMSGVSTTLTTVCDVYYSGSSWVAYYNIGPTDPGYLIYTDIAASDRYVVAAAKKSNSHYYMVSIYTKSNNFLSTPLSTGTKYRLFGDTPLDDLLIEDVRPDAFVLAHYYDSLSLAGTEFELFNIASNTIVPQQYWQVSHGVNAANLGGKLLSLHYDYSRQRLLLLHSARCNQYSGIENTVIEHDIYSIPASFVKGSFIHGVEMNGLDEMPNGHHQTIGTTNPSNDSLTFSHEWDENQPACRKPFELPVRSLPLTYDTIHYPELILTPFVFYSTIQPSKEEVELDTHCEY